jgi:hypothetical protein
MHQHAYSLPSDFASPKNSADRSYYRNQSYETVYECSPVIIGELIYFRFAEIAYEIVVDWSEKSRLLALPHRLSWDYNISDWTPCGSRVQHQYEKNNNKKKQRQNVVVSARCCLKQRLPQ